MENEVSQDLPAARLAELMHLPTERCSSNRGRGWSRSLPGDGDCPRAQPIRGSTRGMGGGPGTTGSGYGARARAPS